MTFPVPAPIKFLLVDDQEPNVVALGALLQREGLEILIATSGQEALELLAVHEIALAFLDVQMPEMDGFALAEAMRGAPRTRHVPVIFVTANPQEQYRVFEGYDAGAVDFLIKPVDPGVLRHKADTFFRLARQKQELAETLRLNEMFVAAVGHDLRNPLNSMMMCAELLAGPNADPETRVIVERLKTSGRRMDRMIEELFDLSRVRLGGGLPITRGRCDVRPLAERAVNELRSSHPGRAIELEVTSVVGDWDAARIEQVISNLVGNALTHGEPSGAVRVRIAPASDLLELRVHNEGAIPVEMLDQVFAPFVAKRKGTKRGEGLGLGLYIVEQIVLSHGGNIAVHSSAEDGTEFDVAIPLHSPPAAPSSG